MPRVVRPINLKKPVVNRKLIAWAFLLTGVLSLGGWMWARYHNVPSESTVPGSTAQEDGGGFLRPLKISYTVTPKPPSAQDADIIPKLQSQLDGRSGQYGIYVFRLGDKVGYGLGSDRVFPAMSILKVPIMVATYRQVEEGELGLNDIQELLEAIGKRSDNEAPTTLINMVGRPLIRQTVIDLGMTHSDFDANTTTAYDVAQMWKTLYEGQLISTEHWQQMQDFLTDSIFEERIPAGVAGSTRVVHKVGTDVDVWADSGIVYSSRPFVIVILNDEVSLEEAKTDVPSLVRTIYLKETSTE